MPSIFAGCSEEQATIAFDPSVLLTAPREVIVERLRIRTTNPFARGDQSQILSDLDAVEPLLHRSADLILGTAQPPGALADQLLQALAAP